MKIALVSTKYDMKSGVARCVAELGERLASDNEVHVITRSVSSQTDKRIRFHILSDPPLLRSWIVGKLVFFFRSGLYLRNRDFDVVHLHTPSFGACHVITCHGLASAGLKFVRSLDAEIRSMLPRQLLIFHSLLRPVNEYNYRQGKHQKVIALSSRIKQELIELCGVRDADIHLIPNGVDCGQFTPSHRGRYLKEIRDRLHVDESDFLLLFVGRFFKRKGLTHALRALAKLGRDDIKLLVVGQDKSDQKEHVDLARTLGIGEQVIFFGIVSQGIEQFYAASDAFVFPSFYEANALVLLEAMAAGLPVISSTAGAADEFIQDGENGILLEDVTSTEELASKILRLRTERDLALRMGERARRTAERFSWERTQKETSELYKKIVERRKAPT